MSIKDFKVSEIDSSKGLSIGKYSDSEKIQSKAHGVCGSGYNCSGGGGRCGSAWNCTGGGGRCGSAWNCSGS